MTRPAVIILSEQAASTGRAIADAIGGELVGARARVTSAERLFDEARAEVQALFAAGRPIVAVMASGALIRLVAPLLSDKMVEPPVIAVAEDGTSAVPLLGGIMGRTIWRERLLQS